MDNHIAHVRKDIAYSQLSAEKQTLLPASLPCEMELTDADLEAVYGSRADNAGVLGTLGDLGIFGVLGNPGNPGNPGASSLPKGSTNPGASNS
jgi:hypothetical protein